MIRATTRDEINRAQREFQEIVAAREPWQANAEAAMLGHDDGLLLYRNLSFRVPPVPYRAGLAVRSLSRYVAWVHRELKKLEDSGKFVRTDKVAARHAEEEANALEELAALYLPLVRPYGLRTRWALRGGVNPFADPTEQEVRDLADFFHRRRTTSHVRARRSIRAPRYLHSTWQTSARPLWQGIPPELRRKVFRAAGNTTARALPR